MCEFTSPPPPPPHTPVFGPANKQLCMQITCQTAEHQISDRQWLANCPCLLFWTSCHFGHFIFHFKEFLNSQTSKILKKRKKKGPTYFLTWSLTEVLLNFWKSRSCLISFHVCIMFFSNVLSACSSRFLKERVCLKYGRIRNTLDSLFCQTFCHFTGIKKAISVASSKEL